MVQEYSVLSNTSRYKLICHIHSLSVITFSDLISIGNVFGTRLFSQKSMTMANTMNISISNYIMLLPHRASFYFLLMKLFTSDIYSLISSYIFLAKMQTTDT